jgi:hypothetical protein
MMMTKMSILKVMFGSWNSMGLKAWSKVTSLWVPLIGSSDIINSSTPMERALAQLVIIMQDITNECKEGDVTFCEQATSHMRVLACNICFTKATAIYT